MSSSTTSSGRRSSRKKKILYLSIGVGILLTTIAGVSVVPLGRAFENSRAKGIVAEANTLFEQGKLADSFEKARRAFDLAPENPEVMRLMGNLMKDNPQTRDSATYFFSELKNKGKATVDDEVALASIHLMSGNKALCREIVDELLQKAPSNPKLLTLTAKLNQLSGSGMAVKNATNERIRKAAEFTGDSSSEEKLELARAQILSSSSSLRSSGMALLWEITDGEDLSSLESLRLLATSQGVNYSQGTELVDKLRAHPLASERHQLIATSLQLRMEPSRREELIANEVKERLGQPVSELDEFLGWLLREGESSWILDLLPLDTAKKHPTALAYTLEALAKEGRWNDLKELISAEDVVISEARRSLFLANCAKNLNEPEGDVRKLINQTINLGSNSGDSQTVASATQLAESAGYDELTRLGLSVLATSDIWKERALMGYYGLAAKGKDIEEMLTSADAVLKVSPTNERFQAISAYLNLLKGTNIEVATATCEQLNATNPSTSRQALVGLAKFRAGDIGGSRRIFDSIDPIDIEPGQRAVQAWIRFITGDVRPAIEIAQKIPTPLLNKAEEGMVNQILGIN